MRDALVEMTHATTVLLGRKNYEGFGAYWPTVTLAADAEVRDRRFARWLDEVDKVVFSTRLERAEWNNSRLADASPAEVVRRLRSMPGGDIRVLSSQSIICQLLDADEIDRLEITLAPHTDGGGSRLFDDSISPSTWSLTSATPTDTSAIRLVYDRPGPPAPEVVDRTN